MGFYISKDGFYVMSTLDSTKYRYLTEKGKMMTYYVKKIQRWWRGVLGQKIRNESIIKIQKWWREILINRKIIKIQKWWKKQNKNKNKNKEFQKNLDINTFDLLIPLYFINILILLFAYILN
jgi:hypothetical protein